MGKGSPICGMHMHRNYQRQCMSFQEHVYIYSISQVHLYVWHGARTLGTGDTAGNNTHVVSAPMGLTVQCFPSWKLDV